MMGMKARAKRRQVYTKPAVNIGKPGVEDVVNVTALKAYDKGNGELLGWSYEATVRLVDETGLPVNVFGNVDRIIVKGMHETYPVPAKVVVQHALAELIRDGFEAK